MTMHKQSLLMITIELPFPPTSGGRMKSWNMVDFLGRHYELGVACPVKYGDSELVAFASKTSLKHFLTSKVEKPRNAISLLKSYLLNIPINVYRSRSTRLKRLITEIADQYDIILLDHYESSWYLPENFKGKVILHTHNATYLMWERYAKSDASLPYRLVTWLEAIRVKHYEKRAAALADLVFASPNDIDNLVAIGVDRSKCRVTYHLGDDSQLELPSLKFSETEKALLYIGTLNWEANIDGLLWFFESVWPEVRTLHPDLYFYVVGGKPDPRLLDAGKHLPGVEFTGFADELEPYFQKARLFMAPLRFGSGIKVKVLNSMCRGMPIITTPVGSEGLIAEHMVHLSITDIDKPADMVKAIDILLTDEHQWSAMEQASRALVTEHYTWKKVLGYMVEEINKLSTDEQPD
jgi:glycosyltransferase involved in cell wall biosynthesis